jgi:penicillin-binding protein 1C
VNKKKQKNFITRAMGVSRAKAHGPSMQKFFGSFFQKRTAYFLSAAVLFMLAHSLWVASTFVVPRPTAIMTDRNGVFMAQLGGGPAGYGYWPATPVPPRVALAILALEDKRFWDHPGIDPAAVLRAMAQDISAGRRVSGASTLAMQVARMQHPQARTWAAKASEAAAAVLMTARYGREAVLAQYLMLAPFGQNSHGIAYAAEWYFNRPVQDLSWAQIALLSAIPQSPGLYNLDHPEGLARAKARAQLALARLHSQGIIDAPDYTEALADLAGLTPRQYPQRQPEALHAILLAEAMAASSPPVEQLRSTIDLGLEQMVSRIATQRLAGFQAEGARQVAVIVADRQSMGVLAFIGSGGYAARDDGEIDYALSWRSPGSTLKPFIYAQALDRGTISPASMVLDGADSGTGVDNADLRFLGPMLPAQALANSRNVPAAALVRADGLDASHWFLTQLGLSDSTSPAARYGLTLAIGGMPTDLTRLVAAYGALANDGAWRPLRWYEGQPAPPPARTVSVDTARLVTLFLADPMARLPSFGRMGSTEFPFPVAVKTGTSQGYRDAWVVEYTGQYVVGVWVGRPDDQPMDELGGAASAALIGQDILLKLYSTETDGQNDGSFAAPQGTQPQEVCAATQANGHCAQQMVVYLPSGAALPPPPAPPAVRFRITAPLDHSTYILNPDTPPGLAVLALRIAPVNGAAQVEWYVDGQAYQMAKTSDTVEWPVTPGRHVFEAGSPFSGARSTPVVVAVQ